MNSETNYLLKISASGNRFLLADSKYFSNEKPPRLWQTQTSPKLFKDFMGLTKLSLDQRKSFLKELVLESPLTDGLLVLDREKKPLSFDFYNKDGSQAEMCGNAACCVSHYIEEMKILAKEFYIWKQKIIPTSKGGILLDKPKEPVLNFKEPFSFSFIDTGVPHGVIPCLDLDFLNKADLKKQAQALRFKNVGSYKKGMNVSFYKVLSDFHLKAITYERGVEDFTLACGTGALAVSLVYLQTKANPKQALVLVDMPGGLLKVKLEGQKLELFSQAKKSF